MLVRMDIPLSGMNAAARRLAVSAHNTSNLSTDGFAKHRLSAFEGPKGGVATRVDRVELSPEAAEAGARLPQPDNNVQMAMEAVDRISVRHAFVAGVRSTRALDDTLKSLIDATA